MVKGGLDWEDEWYGALPESKVMVLVMSPEYFASTNCTKECATALKQKQVQIQNPQGPCPS